jgi:hypothetical protein
MVADQKGRPAREDGMNHGAGLLFNLLPWFLITSVIAAVWEDTQLPPPNSRERAFSISTCLDEFAAALFAGQPP